jgi:MFS family permease
MLDSRPLRSAAFRHLAAAYWVNEFGNWIGEIALTLLVYDRTHSALATAGLFLALRFLPALVAPFLTVRVETLRARVVVTVLYVIEGFFFGGIAWLAHHFSLGAVLALGGLDGLLAITAKALTRSATASRLRDDGLLREGNGILNLGAMTSTAGSPVIAGVLVAWRGAAAALLLDAATFLAAALIIATAPEIRLTAEAKLSFTRRLDEVVAQVRGHLPLRRLLVAIALVMAVGAIPVPIEVVFVRHTLRDSASAYGLLLGSWGIGMVIGGAGFIAGSRAGLNRLLVVGVLLTALGYGGIAASPTLAVACVFSAIGGIGNGAAWVAAVTAVQEVTSPGSQSAVMSVLEGLNQVMPAIGFVIGGLLTAATSTRVAFGVAAVLISAVVAVAALRWSGAESPAEQKSDLTPSTPSEPAQASPDAQESSAGERIVAEPNLMTG